MQCNNCIKKLFACCLLSLGLTLAAAQSVDGWYKVFTGKMGNYTATLHLHKTAKNYSGYLWFMQTQLPMQLYYNEASTKTDSLILSASNGPLNFTLSGILSGDKYIGNTELLQANATAQQAAFILAENNDKAFTPFSYYYTEGFARLPPQFKNQSSCHYIASAIWPVNNSNTEAAYKKEIRQMFSINGPVEEIGRWLIDEKNRYVDSWRTSNAKYLPKETAGMGLSLTLEEAIRILVMFENEKHITLANYSAGNTGGARASFGTTLSTFSKQTGKKLKLTDVINANGIQLLPVLLDKAARAQFEIGNSKPLNQNGFLVANIKPSANFYITGEGIGFVFAPYVIKPFASGEINLLVPFTALKNYVLPGVISK